jgi:uncharacterized protein YndB with AHSA1/START domain
MESDLIAKSQITINAKASRVWEALTKPELIKQYLFGTEATSDWKVGSPVTYKGVWEGKAYEDKGVILEFVPEKKLVSTYWSGFSGKPDVPENYQKVSYELMEKDGQTTLSIMQDNNPSPESAEHSANNWKMVLGKMKELLEK